MQESVTNVLIEIEFSIGRDNESKIHSNLTQACNQSYIFILNIIRFFNAFHPGYRFVLEKVEM